MTENGGKGRGREKSNKLLLHFQEVLFRLCAFRSACIFLSHTNTAAKKTRFFRPRFSLLHLFWSALNTHMSNKHSSGNHAEKKPNVDSKDIQTRGQNNYLQPAAQAASSYIHICCIFRSVCVCVRQRDNKAFTKRLCVLSSVLCEILAINEIANEKKKACLAWQ